VEPEEERRAPNTVYIEGLGAGLFYTVNYERLVLEDLAVRVGVGYYRVDDVGIISVPISVSYLGLGGQRHMMEIGAGVSIFYAADLLGSGLLRATGSAVVPLGTVFAGYRYHPTGRAGFHFRAGAMALVARGLGFSDPDPDSIGALPWLCFSAGASFSSG